MTNIAGCQSMPIEWGMYESMVSTNDWTGGWVETESGEIVYITKSGGIECKDIGNEVGTELNPFSSVAYDEMVDKGYWPGGYIKYSDTGRAFYKPCGDGYGEKYATACGSGCSTGCGENAMITQGSRVVSVPPFSVVLSWEDGKADVGDGGAALYLSNFVYESNNINMDKDNVTIDYVEAVWTGTFQVGITIRYHMGYGVFGDFYESKQTVNLN